MNTLLLRHIVLFLSTLFSHSQGIASYDYLSHFESNITKEAVHGDVGFLVTQGATVLGHKILLKPKSHFIKRFNEFPFSLEYALWQLRNDNITIERKSFNLINDKSFLSHKSVALKKASTVENLYVSQIKAVIHIMKTAIECRKKGFTVDFIGEPNYEYVSTHQLFALALARHNNCLTPKQYESALPIYATRVKKELDFTGLELSDLQVERAAMLAFIGRIDLVPNTLIKSIEQSQRKDGLWLYANNVTPRFIPKEHTSALAYYLLAMSLSRYKKN